MIRNTTSNPRVFNSIIVRLVWENMFTLESKSYLKRRIRATDMGLQQFILFSTNLSYLNEFRKYLKE